MFGWILVIGEERRGGEGGDPVFVPQQIEQVVVEARLEVRDLEWVVPNAQPTVRPSTSAVSARCW